MESARPVSWVLFGIQKAAVGLLRFRLFQDGDYGVGLSRQKAYFETIDDLSASESLLRALISLTPCSPFLADPQQGRFLRLFAANFFRFPAYPGT